MRKDFMDPSDQLRQEMKQAIEAEKQRHGNGLLDRVRMKWRIHRIKRRYLVARNVPKW